MDENSKQGKNYDYQKKISQNFQVRKKSKKTSRKYSYEEEQLSHFTSEIHGKTSDIKFENPLFITSNSATKCNEKKKKYRKNRSSVFKETDCTIIPFQSQSQSVTYDNNFEEYFNYKYTKKPLIIHDIPERDNSEHKSKTTEPRIQESKHANEPKYKSIIKSVELTSKRAYKEYDNKISTYENVKTIQLLTNSEKKETFSKHKIILANGEKRIRLRLNLDREKLKGSVASIKIKGKGNVNIVGPDLSKDKSKLKSELKCPLILYSNPKADIDKNVCEKKISPNVEVRIKYLRQNRPKKNIASNEIREKNQYQQTLDQNSNVLYPTFIPYVSKKEKSQSHLVENEEKGPEKMNERKSEQNTKKAQFSTVVINKSQTVLPNRPKLVIKSSQSHLKAQIRKKKLSPTNIHKKIKNKSKPKLEENQSKNNTEAVFNVLSSKPKSANSTIQKTLLKNKSDTKNLTIKKKGSSLISFQPLINVKEEIEESSKIWSERKIKCPCSKKGKKILSLRRKFLNKNKKCHYCTNKIKILYSKMNFNHKKMILTILKLNKEDFFVSKKYEIIKKVLFNASLTKTESNSPSQVDGIICYPKMVHSPNLKCRRNTKKSFIPIRKTSMKNKVDSIQINKMIFQIWSESVFDMINKHTTSNIKNTESFRSTSECAINKHFKEKEIPSLKSQSEHFPGFLNGKNCFMQSGYNNNIKGDTISNSEIDTSTKIKMMLNKKPAPKSVSEIKTLDRFINRYRSSREIIDYSKLKTDFQVYQTHTVQPKKTTKVKTQIPGPSVPSNLPGSSRNPSIPKPRVKTRIKSEAVAASEVPRSNFMYSVIQKFKNISKEASCHPNELVTTTIIRPKPKIPQPVNTEHRKSRHLKKSTDTKPTTTTVKKETLQSRSQQPKVETVQIMLLKKKKEAESIPDEDENDTSKDNPDKTYNKTKKVRALSNNSIGGTEDLLEYIKDDTKQPQNKKDTESTIGLKPVSSLELIRRNSERRRSINVTPILKNEKEIQTINQTDELDQINQSNIPEEEQPVSKSPQPVKEGRKKVQFPNADSSNSINNNDDFEMYSHSLENISSSMKHRKSDTGKVETAKVDTGKVDKDTNVVAKSSHSSHNYFKNIKSIFSRESKINQNEPNKAQKETQKMESNTDYSKGALTRQSSQRDFYTEELFNSKKKNDLLSTEDEKKSTTSSENRSRTASDILSQDQLDSEEAAIEIASSNQVNQKEEFYVKPTDELNSDEKIIITSEPNSTVKLQPTKPKSTCSLRSRKIHFVDDLKKLGHCDKFKNLLDSFHKGVYDDLIEKNEDKKQDELPKTKTEKTVIKTKSVHKSRENVSKKLKTSFSIPHFKSSYTSNKEVSNDSEKSHSVSKKFYNFTHDDKKPKKCCSEYFEKNIGSLQDLKCVCPKETQSQACGCRSEPLEISYTCSSSQGPLVSACKCKSAPENIYSHSKIRYNDILSEHKSERDIKSTKDPQLTLLSDSTSEPLEHIIDDSEVFVINPEEIGICFRRGFRPDSLALNGQLCYRYTGAAKPAVTNDSKQASPMINFSERETPLDFLVALGFSVDEASTALKDEQVKNRLTAAITEAKVWANEITTMQGTLLYVIAYKAKNQVMRYFLQLVEAIVNNRIRDVVKLDGFLQLIYKLEMGYLPMLLIFGSDTFEADNDENRMLAKQLQRLFANMFKIAENEAESLNIPFTSNTTKLLQYLIKMYKPGMHSHLELMAKYVGQGLITTEVQLEAALIYLSRLETTNFNLREFEQYCGLQQLKE